MERCEKFQLTEWRPTNVKNEFIRAKYGFHYLKGNRRPYFSITADIAEPAAPHNRGETKAEGPGLPQGKTFRNVGGGCCHELISQYFPELAPLVRWHLVDDDGVPMHYLANGDYWMRKHLEVYRVFASSEMEGRRYGEPDPLDIFKSTIVYGAVPTDDIELDAILSIPTPKPQTIPDLALSPKELRANVILPTIQAWLRRRLPSLQIVMGQNMVKFGVKYINLQLA